MFHRPRAWNEHVMSIEIDTAPKSILLIALHTKTYCLVQVVLDDTVNIQINEILYTSIQPGVDGCIYTDYNGK